MVTPHLIIVGNSTTVLRSYLSSHGFDFTTIKDERLTKFPNKRLKHRELADFSSRENLLQVIDELHAKKPIHGVLVVYERFIADAAAIADHLGLPGLPLAAAEACTDKFVMRQKFSAAPQKISPDFAVVTSQKGVRAFAQIHDFPLILKPANLSKSLLVSKANNLGELIQNYAKTMRVIDSVYARYAPGVTPKLLIEEFMEGSVHSVDAFVDAHGEPHVLDAVVDYQTGYDIGFNDNFHYSRLLPSKLPAETIAHIREVAALGCQALGMKNSPAHVEIILTTDGPRIVEIGARNGGYRDRMHALANGLDLDASVIRLSLGQAPHVDTSKNEPVGVFELFPKTPGIFTSIACEDRLRELPSLVSLSVHAKEGEFVGTSSDGYKMCAVVILHHQNPEQFAKDMAFLNDHVHVQTATT